MENRNISFSPPDISELEIQEVCDALVPDGLLQVLV